MCIRDSTCVAFGALNGILVTGVKLPAFIVTLGTFNIAFALTHVYSDDLTFTGLPSELLFFGRTFELAVAGVCLLGAVLVPRLARRAFSAVVCAGGFITAVVLGGTSLFGGRGSIIGTLIGAVIVGVFRNGLTLIGVQVIYQYLVTGILVILAVSVAQLTHRRSQ